MEKNNQNKKNFGIRDIMTIAAMMVIWFIITMLVGSLALPIPQVYLYFSAGIVGFFSSSFFLIAANRVNKHGLLFAWIAIYGLIEGLVGYTFMIPYFLLVAAISEATMIGKDTYRKPVRTMIGWTISSVGTFIGNAIPIWWSWESFKKMALESGFVTETLVDMNFAMVTTPSLMLLGIVITAVLTILGLLFGQRLLRKHFKKAGIV